MTRKLKSDLVMEYVAKADALARTFGGEWDALSDSDQRLIVRDCTEDGGVDDFAEYRRNIGTGNLASYARVMRVRFGAS